MVSIKVEEEGLLGNPKKAIEEVYSEKMRKSRNIYVAAVALSTAIGGSFSLYFGLSPNPHEESPVVLQYKEMRETLDVLNSRRRLEDSIDNIEIPYMTEPIRADLEELFNYKIKRAGVLDKVIYFVESDLLKTKEKKEFRIYDAKLNKNLKDSFSAAAITLLADIGLAFSCIHANRRIKSKKKMRLEM